MDIPAKLVKELRELTNAGFSDCRAALVETSGDIQKAIDVLRKKGQAAAAKKASREATEGLIGHYIHAGGKIGVIVEINCESDFVARTDAFQQLCHDVAMHIAAVDPRYVRREDVTPEMLEREREIYLAQARATALKARPGKITDQELEKEGGGSGLRYSFDISSAGKTYEVGVDAKTGKVLENGHESAGAEATEAAKEPNAKH